MKKMRRGQVTMDLIFDGIRFVCK